jgi:hypothetical protein
MIHADFMKMDESFWTPDEQVEAERRRRNFMRAAGPCAFTLLALGIANSIVKRMNDQQRMKP